MFLPVKSLAYPGFENQPCFCDYLVISEDSLPGGLPGIIFVQRSRMPTSITNRIEIIASMMLKQDFLGVSPGSLRFFEYYPAHLQPIIDWQEVSFSQMDSHFLKNDLWSRTAHSLFSATPDYWSVDKPMWHAVAPTLKAQLRHLV
jgi:hypothetical protein